jgi:GDP-L-fucose synthase
VAINLSSKIYIAGHNGMVGSAIWRNLESKGYTNLIGKSSKELDLRNQAQVEAFFEKEKPEYVFLAAAKVGGILANDTYRAEFIYDNLMIQNNLIHQSYVQGIKKLLFLGSSCIYPRDCPQPMKEEYLLTGELEQTNEPYAIAKIAGIKMCENYNRQYGTNFISVMPTNLYGPGDNYNLETSHVLPALLRKFHLGKCLEDNNWNAVRDDLNKNPINNIDGSVDKEQILNILKSHGITITQIESSSSNLSSDSLEKDSVHSVVKKTNISPDSSTLPPASSNQFPATSTVAIEVWGSGNPLREFLHVDDLADACTFLFENYNIETQAPTSYDLPPDASNLSPTSCLLPPFYNIGTGKEISIRDLAIMIKTTVDFKGEIIFKKNMKDGTLLKCLDSSLLKKLGWESTVELKIGIQKTYKHWINQ